MTIKDLLLHLDPGPGTPTRVAATMALADRFGARVTALHLIPEPFMPGVVGHHMPDDVLREHLARAAAEAEGMVAATREAAARRGVPLALVRASGPVDRLPSLLARHARYADLAVLGRPDPRTGGADDVLLAEAAFLDSGRPALLVPAGETDPTLPPWRVLIAWDGSREAARALADALPLLREADSTVVLVVGGPDAQEPLGGHAPEALLADHLARHGVKAEVKRVQGGGRRAGGTGEVILAQAQEEAAELLVLGGYGHSRFRERMLGGTTRFMLEHATVPVLIAH
jgi:nucleotide-binding universal stress UspA family protein